MRLLSCFILLNVLFEVVFTLPPSNIESEFNKMMVIEKFSTWYSKNKNNKSIPLPDISHENQHFKLLLKYVKEGATSKCKIFTLYDDNIREATIALYRLLKSLNTEDRVKVEKWAQSNINRGIYNYAKKIHSLFGGECDTKFLKEIPEFMKHTNHFIRTQVIIKLVISNYYKLIKKLDPDPAVEYMGRYIIINSNYANDNLDNDVSKSITYFTEDVSLNSYYYGISLAHPFWMSDEEMRKVNPRHNEQFYFLHKQLLSRFFLEIYAKGVCNPFFQPPYNPRLLNDNAIEFPIRPQLNINATEQNLKLKTIDTAIRESMAKGFVLLDNGTTVNFTEDNHIDLLVNMIRINLDGVKMGNKLKSFLGSGRLPKSNSIPTFLHYPETMLRDPGTFMMMYMALEYIFDYLKTLEPYNLKKIDTSDFKILAFSHTRIETFFEDYVFDITCGLRENPVFDKEIIPFSPGAVKQRRLNSNAFTIDLILNSTVDKYVTVRYFLGPLCNSVTCCENIYHFFQLEQRREYIVKGHNVLKWDSRHCFSCSNDDYFNLKNCKAQKNEYNIFQFPRRLLMPRGTKEGMKFTLFVIITEDDIYDVPKNNYIEQVFQETTSRPRGFPFNRFLKNCDQKGNNYAFFNITIYHTYKERKKPTSFWSSFLSYFGF